MSNTSPFLCSLDVLPPTNFAAIVSIFDSSTPVRKGKWTCIILIVRICKINRYVGRSPRPRREDISICRVPWLSMELSRGPQHCPTELIPWYSERHPVAINCSKDPSNSSQDIFGVSEGSSGIFLNHEHAGYVPNYKSTRRLSFCVL
jgi:hypothetical protein